MATKSMLSTQAALDAATAFLDSGSTLVIYAGAVPASADTALSGQTLLTTHTMTADPVGDAAPDGSQAKSLCNPIADAVVASPGGTCTFWRMLDLAGTAIFQGTAGTTGVELTFADDVFVTGGNVSINNDFALTLGI